jgi:hypothetical protein
MRFASLDTGTVNCYLFRTGIGCALIDTGFPSNRDELEKLGCRRIEFYDFEERIYSLQKEVAPALYPANVKSH